MVLSQIESTNFVYTLYRTLIEKFSIRTLLGPPFTWSSPLLLLKYISIIQIIRVNIKNADFKSQNSTFYYIKFSIDIKGKSEELKKIYYVLLLM